MVELALLCVFLAAHKTYVWQILFNRFGRKLGMGAYIYIYIYNTNSSKICAREIASGKFLYCSISNILIRQCFI